MLLPEPITEYKCCTNSLNVITKHTSISVHMRTYPSVPMRTKSFSILKSKAINHCFLTKCIYSQMHFLIIAHYSAFFCRFYENLRCVRKFFLANPNDCFFIVSQAWHKTAFPEINSPSSRPRGVFVANGWENIKHRVPAYERRVTDSMRKNSHEVTIL